MAHLTICRVCVPNGMRGVLVFATRLQQTLHALSSLSVLVAFQSMPADIMNRVNSPEEVLADI